VTRPSVDDVLMHCAYAWAARGTCTRLQVGALFARDGRILATGYNGAPSGMPHCEHLVFRVPGRFGVDHYDLPYDPKTITVPDWLIAFARDVGRQPNLDVDLGLYPGRVFELDNGQMTLSYGEADVPTRPCTRSVHAEANAVAFAARHGVSLLGASLYTTTAPCGTCALLLVSVGVSAVVADQPYARESTGEQLLREAGVELRVNQQQV